MNTTPPPTRDLPPGRHAQLRAALLQEVAQRRRVLPLVTAAAALVVIGLLAWFVGWGSDGATRPAGPPPSPTIPAPGAPVTSGTSVPPAAEIAAGCAESAGVTGYVTLRQLIVYDESMFALVYSDEHVLGCTIGGPVLPYNSGFATLGAMPGPVSMDYNEVSAGDTETPEPQQGGYLVAGRVDPEVARVVYVQGEESVEGVLADGTYVARIVKPVDWLVPEDRPTPLVRAYDENDVLLGTATAP